MVLLELTCTIVGEGRAFDVKVDDRWKATKLQEAIQTKNKNDLGKVDAKDLQLYLAKKGEIWLISAGAASVALGGDETLQGFEKMDPTLFIKNPKYFGANFQPGESEVHVLVVVLKSPAGGVTAAAPTEEIPGAKRLKTEAAVDRTASLNGGLVPIIEMAQQLNPETRLTVGSWLDVPLTSLGRFDTGLFVRKEYWDLHKMITQRLASNDKMYRVLVVGSPGIGKSVFGVFLLLVLMMEKKDVANRVFGQVTPYYFSWNGTKYEISRTPVAGKRYEGLFDGDDTGGALDSFLFLHAYVFASPRTTNYNHFVKEGCFKVCMNPWTKTECRQLADALHLDDEDEDEWYRRYNLVGGNPRFLFSTAETLDSLVERVKGDVPHDIEDLKRMIHLFKQELLDFNSLVNLYRRDDDPSRSYLVYSSLAVEVIVSERGKEMERFLLQDLATRKFCVKALEGNVGEASRVPRVTHTLLFIVPDDIFDEFPAQPYTNDDDKSCNTEIDIDVTQCVGKTVELVAMGRNARLKDEFVVDIDAGESVGDLKVAIKKKIIYPYSAHKLQLFLAKKGDEWLDWAGAASVTLDEHGTLQGFGDEMDDTRCINNANHIGANFQPGKGEVHVLVVFPACRQ